MFPHTQMRSRSPGKLAEVLGNTLQVTPIGYVRSAHTTKVEVARQPAAAAGVEARVELLTGYNFEHALEDLDSWEFIWVLFWFHQNAGWRPKVLPPRSTSGRKGVFATRAPHRPNPIGMSVVRLVRIEGLVIHVSDSDMLNGTPVLDIKPYVAYNDAHPTAGAGWLEGRPVWGLRTTGPPRVVHRHVRRPGGRSGRLGAARSGLWPARADRADADAGPHTPPLSSHTAHG